MSEPVREPVRKTFTYQLAPTPDQERALDRTRMLCRHVYHCALEQRKSWWERGQDKSATY